MNPVRRIIPHIIIITTAITLPLSASAVSIHDPLNAESVFEVAARFIQAVLGLVGAVALIHFVLAGFGIILSKGNPESLKKHRDNLLWTTIGIVVLFAAYALISFALEKLTGI